jgi:hypothetical protein
MQTTIDFDRAGITIAEDLEDGFPVRLPSTLWRNEGVKVAQSAYDHGAENFTLLDSRGGVMWIVPGLPSEGSTTPGDRVLYVAAPTPTWRELFDAMDRG